MLEWLSQLMETAGLTWQYVLLGLLLSAATFASSIAVVSWVLVKLPATYFHPSHDRDFWVERHRALRWGGIIAKNLSGGFLVVLGVIMSLPGVPGQGVLTILLGVMLLDLPGKRRLEHRIVSHPKVFRAINGLRARFGRPPLVLG